MMKLMPLLKHSNVKNIRMTKRNMSKRFMKYMVAVDGSDNSIEAIEKCRYIANMDDKVYIIHVIEPVVVYYQTPQLQHPSSGPDMDKIRKTEEDMVEHLKKNLKERIPDFPEGYEFIFKEGPPAYTVCEEVNRNKIDFLVVGDRGLSRVKKFMLGSFANYCVNYAPCSVIITKNKERARRDFLKINF